MSSATGDIVATPGADQPLKVVLRERGEIVSEHPASTASEAESLLRTGLSRLAATAKIAASGR